jgi:alpha-tubulin suppressor-like RCC1 family protein
MNASQATLRRAAVSCSPARPQLTRQWARKASSRAPQTPRRRGGKLLGFGLVFGAATAASYYYPQLKAVFIDDEPAGPLKPELEFEKARKRPVSKEENRELISSQHLQVEKSWEHPGVYVWGSNVGKVVDPESKEKNVKLPRRLKFFDDQILRDLKLTQNFGAAVTEKGDLVQWGLGFSKTDPAPKVTLKGKDIAKIDVSLDRVIALTGNGSVFSVPATSEHPEITASDQAKSSWSLWSSSGSDAVTTRNLTPPSLGYGEKITDISSGLEHCLLLTSRGRVFSAASSTSEFPSHGQMGIQGLTWETRPKGPYDQPHEITALKGFKVAHIATGDRHSVVLDKLGRIFSFGDNLCGQLGFEAGVSAPLVDSPALVPTTILYNGTGLKPTVTSIAAGGNNTFFTVEADATTEQSSSSSSNKNAGPARRLPRTTADLWAAGQGVYGALGTGRWTHVSLEPSKVKALSSLYEFNETTNKMMPIKLKSLSIGATHCAAVMDNVTETSLAQRASQNETYWGSDVLFWGSNEHYQLGNGKRNNQNAPVYIGPLDGGAGDAAMGRKGEQHRLCLTPRSTARIGEGGKGRKVTLEQKVECGQFVTGVYSSV